VNYDPVERLFARTHDKRLTRQLVRYGIVAGSGYLLAIALYTGELAIGIAPYLALGATFILNGLYNFVLIRRWAFPPSGKDVHHDLLRFGLVACLSLLLNYASFAVLYSSLELDPATAQRIAILIAAPITFLANRLWSFRVSPDSHAVVIDQRRIDLEQK
jgi:putative flippase GtrA